MSKFSFTLKANDGAARTGVISTPRGEVRHAAFTLLHRYNRHCSCIDACLLEWVE